MPECGAVAFDQDGELHMLPLPTESRDPNFPHMHSYEACSVSGEESQVKEGRFFCPQLEFSRKNVMPLYDRGHCSRGKAAMHI